MQKFIYSILIGAILFSCDDSSMPDEINEAPTVPLLTYPTDNLLCIDNELPFEWQASTDSNGDAVTYQIEISKDNQFLDIEHSSTVSTTTQNVTLEKGLPYYWRVKATDSQNASSEYSATFNLYTEYEGVSNHLPFAPELVKPDLNGAVQDGAITLEWEGSDTDEDPLVYDVYFGSQNPPTAVISENQNASTLGVDVLPATNYYWKVVAKDDKNGQTIGQVWTFSTN